MTTDATNGADVGTEQFQPSARNQAMADIARRAHAEVEGEMAEFDEDTGEITATKSAKEEPAEPEQTQEPAKQEEDTDTLIVDGREVKVPKEKIIEAGRRTLQKESAADKRLQEATELFRRAEEYARRVGVTEASQDPRSNTSPPGEGVMTDEGQPNRADVQEFHRTIDQRVEDKLYIRDAEKAARQFEADFPEIASNPMLKNWAARLEDKRIHEAMEQGRSLGDPSEAYRKHGEAVREQLKSLGVVPKTENKQERKRDTVAISGANVRTPAPQADKPKTPAQIIEGMRKARHQRID
jgi:hypothetical protein